MDINKVTSQYIAQIVQSGIGNARILKIAEKRKAHAHEGRLSHAVYRLHFSNSIGKLDIYC